MAYNVLIVEDQGIPRDLFEIYIRGSEQFHHLLSIPNASAALSVCQSSRVDLILMDVMTELGHSGLDADVRDFVMEHPTTREFMRRYTELLDFLIPHYREEGKRRLVIAIGCTGGAHRSVAIAEAIAAYLRDKGLPTEINHRDLLLEQARWTAPVEES